MRRWKSRGSIGSYFIGDGSNGFVGGHGGRGKEGEWFVIYTHHLHALVQRLIDCRRDAVRSATTGCWLRLISTSYPPTEAASTGGKRGREEDVEGQGKGFGHIGQYMCDCIRRPARVWTIWLRRLKGGRGHACRENDDKMEEKDWGQRGEVWGQNENDNKMLCGVTRV